MSAVGTNPKLWSSTWQIAHCLCGSHSLTSQDFTKVVATSCNRKCNSAIPMDSPAWYMTMLSLKQLIWFTLAHWLLLASPMGSPIKLDKVCKLFLEAEMGSTKCTPSLNNCGWSRWQISLARACSKRLVSKFFLLSKLVASWPVGLCFLSLAKHDGGKPNLCCVSGIWSSQCHFFINDTSGKAVWKHGMASSMAGNKVPLLMMPARFPSWTWSMRDAIASKAWQAGAWRPLGNATL